MKEICQGHNFIIRNKPGSFFNPQNGQIAEFISGQLKLLGKSFLR